MQPALLFAIAWIGWIVTWAAAAFWSGRTQKRVSTWEVWVYRVASVASLALLNHRTARALGLPKLWHVGLDGAYALAALTFGGILFAWWARIHLGRLWSGSITVKEGHRVVDSGPYGLVRHPIYTGLIFAVIATAVAQATVTGLAAIALIIIGLWLKARVEERFLAAELGPDDYAAYRRRVPMLVPFMPAGG
jgi:protein-S-isoprenylcysteine O-methyltransferase Ste14